MRPPITIRSLTAADIPTHVRLIRHSFYEANDACNRIMYPSGVTPELLAFFIDKGITEFHAAPPTKHYLGAFSRADDDGEETMLATALWVLEDDTAPSAPSSSTTDAGVISSACPPPTANEAAFATFHKLIEDARPAAMAGVREPYWHLSLLATAPGCERRGAGTALVRWGVERADAEQRMAYLDATEMGRPFYERWAFRVVDAFRLDGRLYGVEREGHWYSMVRQVGGRDKGEGAVNGAPNGHA